jgi:hypothetical protein
MGWGDAPPLRQTKTALNFSKFELNFEISVSYDMNDLDAIKNKKEKLCFLKVHGIHRRNSVTG